MSVMSRAKWYPNNRLQRTSNVLFRRPPRTSEPRISADSDGNEALPVAVRSTTWTPQHNPWRLHECSLSRPLVVVRLLMETPR